MRDGCSQHRSQEPAAGEADRAVEREQETRADERNPVERPKRLRVRPRRAAGRPDVPHREHVVETSERFVGDAYQTAGELGLHPLLRFREQRVDPAEVGVLRAAASRLDLARTAGRDERDGQVTVDMGVHPGERELDRQDALSSARLEQRLPGARHASPSANVVRERGQIEVREDDIEPADEGRIGERTGSRGLADRFRYGEVEPVEVRDSIVSGQNGVKRLHTLHHVGYPGGNRRAQHLLESHCSTTLRPVAAIDQLIDELERSYMEVRARMSDPSVYNDHKEAAEVGRRLKDLEVPHRLAQAWRQASADLDAARRDSELASLADDLVTDVARLEEELKLALVETDPADSKDVILEIRSGVGGDEAAIWAGDVFRMLTRYAERRGFKTEVLSANESETGGFKEVVFAVKGDGAYSVFKYEGGTHRVQRVPETESQGRIHTSTATVAVMPEVEEIDVELDENDLKIDVYRSTGPGGQSVNTTDSAVRITHVPTGIVVAMQDEKSQLQNKVKALRVLRARIYEVERERQQAELSAARKSQIGSGERAEKIRTYNYPDSRVTDHRVKVTLNLEKVLPGGLDDFTEALKSEDQRRALES